MHYYWFTYATTHTYIQYVAIAAIMRSTWLADLALALRDKLVNILMAFFCEDLVHECGFDDWMSRIVLIVDRSGKIVPVLTNESQESRLAMPRARLFASLRLLLLVATLWCAPDRGTSPAFVLSRSWMASETSDDRIETSLGGMVWRG